MGSKMILKVPKWLWTSFALSKDLAFIYLLGLVAVRFCQATHALALQWRWF